MGSTGPQMMNFNGHTDYLQSAMAGGVASSTKINQQSSVKSLSKNRAMITQRVAYNN